MGVFADAAPEYLDHGRPCFPITTDSEKRPLVSGWQKAGRPATREWAEKYPDANVGLCCGPKTGLTVVDVDDPGEEPVADALSRYGETHIIIRTATGKHHLWYRHNGERRQIGKKVKGWTVDILGAGGFTAAPPSHRPDLFSRYEFVQGSLDDLDRLPAINDSAPSDERADALGRAQRQAQTGRADGLVPEGERDGWLFRQLLRDVRDTGTDDEDALRDLAFSYNADTLAPDINGEKLPDWRVEQKVQQALKYEREGRNFVTRPQVSTPHDVQDALIDAPYAYLLLDILQRNHPHPDAEFAVAPKAMADAGNPPWNPKTIMAARDVLLCRGFVELVHKGTGRGNPSRYRLALKSVR